MEQHIFEHRMQVFKGFHYLPLFYFIPEEIAEKRGLADFPRDPYIAVTDEKWRNVYNNKRFQVMLMDTWAWMMWQCLDIKGGIDNYSKNNPLICMVYDLAMWAWLLSQIGITTDFLATYPHGMEVPFLSMEQAAMNGDKFANLFWNHPMLKMRKVWDIVKNHRAHGDYSNMPSHVKMDFHRHYYHTRAKTKVESIINDYGEDGEEKIVYAPYTPSDFAEIETRMWFDEFLKLLNEKDRKIVTFLEEGYTQKEIAEMLGYSNHSGVTKRIKHIREVFVEFQNEDIKSLKQQHALAKQNKRSMTEERATNGKSWWLF